jgi:hypothetical protein
MLFFVSWRYRHVFEPDLRPSVSRMPVHIPHSEIEKLAFQAERVRIFAIGEYPGVTLVYGIPKVCRFSFSLFLQKTGCFYVFL